MFQSSSDESARPCSSACQNQHVEEYFWHCHRKYDGIFLHAANTLALLFQTPDTTSE